MNEPWKQRCVNVLAILIVLSAPVLAGVAAEEDAKTSESPDTILAEFNWGGEQFTVTLGELEKEISELPKYRQDDYEGRDGRAEYLQLMAESRMLLHRGQDLNLQDDPEIVKKVEEYRRQLMTDAISEVEVDDKVSVTDQDVEAYYNENKDKYYIPEQVRVTALTLQDKDEAEKVLAEIKAGTRTFEEVVKGYSDQGKNTGPGGQNGGDTGFFSRDTFSNAEPFVNAAFSMDVGQMTDKVIEVPRFGTTYYMIFRVEEKKEPRQRTLDEVRERVRRTVQTNAENARRDEWENELRTKAGLVVYEDRMPEPPSDEDDSKAEAKEDSDAQSEAAETDEQEEAEEADVEVDPGLVLAEYTWNGKPYTYTYGELKAVFDDLRPYRRSRYSGKEGWLKLLNKQLIEELKLRAAEDAGYGSRDEDLAKLAEYRHQLMVEELVTREVDNQIKISGQDLQAYYDEHKDEYVEPEKVRLIALTYTDKDEAQAMLDEIKNGRDIKEAAQTLSEMGKNLGPGVRNNGDTGYFDRSTYSNADVFTKAAFSMPVGEMTKELLVQELQGQTYYMIFRVEDKKPPRQRPLDEVRSRVESAVERIKKRERLDEWLTELKRESNLRTYPDRLPKYEEVAATESASDEGDAENENSQP